MDKKADLIILGSIALDDIETPFGKRRNIIGGSAVYAARAASFFSRAGILSIAGRDFPERYWKQLSRAGIDVAGVQKGSKTFHWQGFYEDDMASAKTLRTDLNCLDGFTPVLPAQYRQARYVFLANLHPEQQIEVIRQLENPLFIALDTMNLWIEHTKKKLIDAIKKVDMLILNDAEAKQLFKMPSLVQSARKALNLGPKYIVIKKGEHGAVMFSKNTYFSAPAYPVERVKDPTGCGDCFGGGLMGYIAGKRRPVTELELRKAIIYGSVCASYNAEGFGPDKLHTIKKTDIEKRYKKFRRISHF